MIKIITDSTCDLSPELITQNDLRVLPLFVNFKEESFLDGIQIDVPKMISKITSTKVMPKTAAVPPITFFETFTEEIAAGNEVIYLGIGSKFSISCQNAKLAQAELASDQIHIVDSCNLSSGTGLLILKACKLRDEGLSADEICAKLNELVPLVRTQFAINTLEYLHKGGRCSGTTRLFGTALKVRPIIRVINGGMVVAKKPRGKYEKALAVLLDYVKHDLGNIDPDFMMITHCLAENDAEYLREELSKMPTEVENLYTTKAGCVISSHCGPRTIGILYILKK